MMETQFYWKRLAILMTTCLQFYVELNENEKKKKNQMRKKYDWILIEHNFNNLNILMLLFMIAYICIIDDHRILWYMTI